MLDKLFSSDPILSRVQDNVDKALRGISGRVDSTEAGAYSPSYFDATITGATVVINHGLGRVPTGWYIVDLDVQVTIYRTAWDSTTLTLSKGPYIGNPTIKVAVF